jgi:hypothetical protein
MKKFGYLKYKRKRINVSYYVIITTIFVVSLSVGYALLNESLRINGSINKQTYISPNLVPTFTLTSGRYVSGSYGNNVQWSSESYDGKNNLTVYLTRRNSNTQLRTTTLNITVRNVYPLSLTAGTASSEIISGAGNFGSVTPSVGTTTIATNGTTYFRTVFSMRTSVAGTIEVRSTYRYTYSGVFKYFYITYIIT